MIGGAKGIGIGIDFGIPNQYCRATSKPYIEKDVLDSLRVVASAYGKSNNDADRSIVKNLVDASNPFIISNAAFKLNSGFGKYSADFESFDWAVNISQKQHNKATISLNGRLCNHTAIEVDEMKVNIIGNVTELIYWYIANPDDTTRSEIRLTSGINTLPKSYAKDDGQTYNIGFAYISGDSEITIEQIPSFQGAFVTDGIDDLITSTKTVQEMLGGSSKITVVSMIHQIELNKVGTSFTNYCRKVGVGYVRNETRDYGTTGIYGWSISNVNNSNSVNRNLINNILGDKELHSIDSVGDITNSIFSVNGYENASNSPSETSQLAWYWTFIANKVLTTDQINQVIAYYNLDRTLKSDIYCNIAKQGITNENHAEFGDKLIDFSGNGRDIQLNNIAWKGDSGIGKYETELSNTRIWTQNKETTSSPFSSSYNGLSGWIIFANTELTNSVDIPSFKIQVKGLLEGQELIYRYYDSNGQSNVYSITKDGDYTLPSDFRTAKPQTSNTSGFQVVKNEANIITITGIPSHADGLCLDGVNDFGKVTGMPIYKDYTVVTDREIFANTGAISSKNNPGAFVETAGNSVYSFGQGTSGLNFISTRSISYLSKYSYCGQSITAGAAEDGTDMWLGTIRDNDHRFFNGAIYSLMSFPYSMSEFLIEHQLKKHKLGTLYPDMVEFRPIVKSNSEYQVVDCYIDTFPAIVGNYYPINSKLRIAVTTKGAADEVTSLTVNGVSLGTPSVNGNRFIFNGTLSDKSPQKINITIDEYIRFEDIVQPYPLFFEFTDENGNLISWGGKAKVGNTITRTNSVSNANILAGLYNTSNYKLNGKPLEGNSYVVEKSMIFTCTATYLLDNNEPKCILSPRRLRMPNSSYKILGYIPDISGHGNHGKINNSAYASMSGANGYSYDYNNSSFWSDSNIAKVVSGELVEYFAVKNSTGFSNITSGVYKGEIKVTGVTKAISENKISLLRIYTNSTTDNELIDITQDGNYNIDIKGVGDANRVFFYAIPNNPNESIVVRLTEPIYIEQVGEYEGAYCLDGVDDFVTIPTLSSGGKQVLMKVNWKLNASNSGIIYDQRISTTRYPENSIISVASESASIEDKLAYMLDEYDTITYIDGIMNRNITVAQLQGITHNITQCNDKVTAQNSKSPIIGSIPPIIASSYYANMSLYDFMLFDEISTDEEILTLNEYVGIEGNTDDLFNETN